VRSAGGVSYGATKTWMAIFTEGLHLDLKSANSNIAVQALCPGFTYSEFHDAMGTGRAGQAPKSFWLTAEEVVEASLDGLRRKQLYVVPGWRYRLIYSDSGVAELGCIFTTPNFLEATGAGNAAPETTWMTIDYDPAAFRVAYVWISPGRVAADLRIQLARTQSGETQTRVRYRYTGLSVEGNREVEGYDREWFRKKMENWESAMNHYLRTGEKIAPASVEA